MSISVDDLVSSLSSNHIGQEAIDLATLQTQLAQSLFGQPISSIPNRQQAPRGSSYTQPCNTPTGRTPSSSFSWGQMAAEAQRQAVAASLRSADEPVHGRDEVEEDERMVEDLLVPTSPMSPNSTSSNSFMQQNLPSPTLSQSGAHTGFGTYTTEPSLFTSTDPFYLQAAQVYNSSPQSIFSQGGVPAQQSPFMQQPQTYRRETHGYIHSAPSTLSSSGYPFTVGDIGCA